MRDTTNLLNSTIDIILCLTIALLGFGVYFLWLGWNRSRSQSAEAQETILEVEAEALIFGTLEKPLFEIHPCLESCELVAQEATPAMKLALEPILQRAPEMLHLGSRMTAQNYRVVFSPEVTQAFRKGTAELLPSSGKLLPVAREASKGGKFIEIGKVSKDVSLKMAGVAAMSWQILSIATAQHFLNEINAKLAGIENSINDIRAWLEEEKKGELRASLHYLREISSALSRGQLHPDETQAIYGQLDTIERIAVSIGELAREISIRRLRDLDKLDVREWMDRNGSAHRLREWIGHNKEAMNLLMLAQAVRVVGCQVKSILPGDQQRLADRLENARQEVVKAQDQFESTRDAFLGKIHELRKRQDNLWALGGFFDEDLRRDLENEFVSTREVISQATSNFMTDTKQALAMAQQIDNLGEKGMEIEIRYRGNGELQILTPRKNAI